MAEGSISDSAGRSQRDRPRIATGSWSRSPDQHRRRVGKEIVQDGSDHRKRSQEGEHDQNRSTARCPPRSLAAWDALSALDFRAWYAGRRCRLLRSVRGAGQGFLRADSDGVIGWKSAMRGTALTAVLFEDAV